MNAEDAKVAVAVERDLPWIATAVEGITARMCRAWRLNHVGAGISGRLGVLDAPGRPPTFGTPPELVVNYIAGGPCALTKAVEKVEDSPDVVPWDAARLGITEVDAVVGITASGRMPYVLGALNHASAQRALTIGLAHNVGTRLEQSVAIMITPVAGPAVIASFT